jgi:glucuronokinase
MIIRSHAYPRAALIGNPSDGYYGKTIAFTFSDFAAEIVLYETPELAILPSVRDGSVFRDIDHLAADVRLFGYYGGIRLLKAAIKRFHDYCGDQGLALHARNFTIRYSSTIPNLVGLAGSSAIITACMRALLAFYDVAIPKPQLANLIRAVENVELDIAAGLQDRVAQVYQGLVYMDFDRELMERQGFGRYEPLNAATLPPLFIAFRTDLSEGSEIYHNNLRERFERGEPEVLQAMRQWAALTDQARDALAAGNARRLGELMNANFDLRATLTRVSDGNRRLIETARSVGASANFSGSGGAIVGTCEDEAMFRRLQAAFAGQPTQLFRPHLI